MDNCKENDNKKNFYFISGLPRTGSTLLSSILYQNPLIHTEGNSALCQLMWDIMFLVFIIQKNNYWQIINLIWIK